MEKLIELYFYSETTRIRLFLTPFYLICVVLITKNILALFGYIYAFPRDITVATVLNFILSGEILLPFLFLTIYIYLTYLLSHFLYNRLLPLAKKTVIRHKTDWAISGEIRQELIAKKYIAWENLQMVKGLYYESYKKWLHSMFFEPFNVGSLYRLHSALFFNLLVLLIFFSKSTTLIFILTIIVSFIYSILVICNFYYLRLIEFIPFHFEFINHIENPNSYPTAPFAEFDSKKGKSINKLQVSN